MGHLAVSLKMCQAQEPQNCEWPQGIRRVLAVLWKQMTHSSPDVTRKQESIGQGHTWRVGHLSLSTGQVSSVSRGTGFPVRIHSKQLHENLQNTYTHIHTHSITHCHDYHSFVLSFETENSKLPNFIILSKIILATIKSLHLFLNFRVILANYSGK